ncbi:MAG: hypothetical protein Tsb0013_01640 [Phycisphaerales bacterium]
MPHTSTSASAPVIRFLLIDLPLSSDPYKIRMNGARWSRLPIRSGGHAGSIKERSGERGFEFPNPYPAYRQRPLAQGALAGLHAREPRS